MVVWLCRASGVRSHKGVNCVPQSALWVLVDKKSMEADTFTRFSPVNRASREDPRGFLIVDGVEVDGPVSELRNTDKLNASSSYDVDLVEECTRESSLDISWVLSVNNST